MNKYSIIITAAVFLISVSSLAQSPGVQLGTTWYDMQTVGSSGNRIALCDDGSMYICWTDASYWPPPPRGVSYCWRSPSGEWNCGILGGEGGCPQLDIYQGYRGVFTYDFSYPFYIVRLAIDDSDYPGHGYFQRFNIPNIFNDLEHIRPYITVDRNNRIHILMTCANPGAGDPMDFIYVQSADGGYSWTTPEVVDTLMAISAVFDASPVSNKVIIAYTHPTTYDCQCENDIIYILSEDGVSWDFRNGKTNVTDYANDDDSLWAYTDMDVIFDYNDNFHFIWNAVTIDSEGYIQLNTRLFHYNSSTGEINLIHMSPEENEWSSGCDPGAWNLPICKMNLGVNESNVLFATWTQFDTSDCSQGGYANGEIYMSYTYDGTDWREPVNLTNSHTPGCYPEECDSDHWSTLADVVNDTLHIMYINDKDAGCVHQNEGIATENPVMYLVYTLEPIIGIDKEVTRPVNFTLDQNYPNPFNEKTVISFELIEPSHVLLEIFDITGAKVATLVDGFIQSGSHSVTWNAESLASGVYFYRLRAGNSSQTKRAVLIK